MVVSPVAVEKLAHSKFAKLLRVRKLYKRFFPVSWTFSITRFSTIIRKTDFFNSQPCSRQLSRNGNGSSFMSITFPITHYACRSSTVAANRIVPSVRSVGG